MLIPEIIEDLLVKYTLRNNDPYQEERPLSRKPNETSIFAVMRDLDELDDQLPCHVYRKLRETLENMVDLGFQDIERSYIVAALRKGSSEVAEIIAFDAITKNLRVR